MASPHLIARRLDWHFETCLDADHHTFPEGVGDILSNIPILDLSSVPRPQRHAQSCIKVLASIGIDGIGAFVA